MIIFLESSPEFVSPASSSHSGTVTGLNCDGGPTVGGKRDGSGVGADRGGGVGRGAGTKGGTGTCGWKLGTRGLAKSEEPPGLQ